LEVLKHSTERKRCSTWSRRNLKAYTNHNKEKLVGHGNKNEKEF